jgi:hypothetical protein
MKTSTRLGGLAAALALSIPAVAQAHPGVYAVDARVAKTAALQTITVDATGGSFTPSAGAAAVPFDATADQVEAALQADPKIGYDNIDVTGPQRGPYQLRWAGTLAGTTVAPLTPDATDLTGTVQVSVSAPGGDAVTFLTDALGATMATQRQYVVANDGYAQGYRETNGVAGGGLLNLKMLPGAFRAPMTPEQKISYRVAHTGLQVHATCAGVPALEDPTNIWSAEKRADNDPFFGYIPWQKTSAGLGDDPAAWIGVVQTLTGVDLSALSGVDEFKAACASIGGAYHPADLSSAVASSMVADAVTPLKAQIAQLTTERDAAVAARDEADAARRAAEADAAALRAGVAGGTAPLEARVAALTSERDVALAARRDADAASSSARADAAAARAELARLKLQAAKLTLAVDGPVALDGTRTPVAVTGPAGAPVRLRIVLSESAARRLHVRSRVLGSGRGTIGADAKAVVNVAVVAKARAAAQKAGAKRIVVDATAGDRVARIPAGS